MSFNINSFVSNINRYGVLKSNRFEILINGPIEGLTSDMIDLIRLRGERLKVPGILMDFIEGRRYGVGPSEKIAMNSRNDLLSVSFLETSNMRLSRFFYDWSKKIVDIEPSNVRPTFFVSYKESYVSTINVFLYNEFGKRSDYTMFTFYEAFPVSVSDSSLAWDNSSLYKIDVSFTYSYFKKELVRYQDAAAPNSIPNV